MSYPDLGRWADLLDCELCDDDWSDDEDVDLDVPDDFDDWDDEPADDFWDPPPDDGDRGLLDDLDVPGVDLPGGGRGTPDWNNGPGFQLEWPWG